MSDLETKFKALDSLDKLFPFFRCPECGERKDFYVEFTVIGTCAVTIDNPTKVFQARDTDAQIGQWRDVQVHCNKCEHVFPFPKEWGLKVV